MLHGGNFYGSHSTHVADTVKLHLAHAAELLERQLVLLCHSTATSGLPENLIAAAEQATDATDRAAELPSPLFPHPDRLANWA